MKAVMSTEFFLEIKKFVEQNPDYKFSAGFMEEYERFLETYVEEKAVEELKTSDYAFHIIKRESWRSDKEWDYDLQITEPALKGKSSLLENEHSWYYNYEGPKHKFIHDKLEKYDFISNCETTFESVGDFQTFEQIRNVMIAIGFQEGEHFSEEEQNYYEDSAFQNISDKVWYCFYDMCARWVRQQEQEYHWSVWPMVDGCTTIPSSQGTCQTLKEAIEKAS